MMKRIDPAMRDNMRNVTFVLPEWKQDLFVRFAVISEFLPLFCDQSVSDETRA